MKTWNWLLVLYLASGLFNVLARKRCGTFFDIVRAVGLDLVAVWGAGRGKDVPVFVEEEEGPTPARASQVPTRKQSVFVKRDGPDEN